MNGVEAILTGITKGDFKSIARAITWVENELPGFELLLKMLHHKENVPVVGFTGPPGAGKSSIINSLTGQLTSQKKKVAVVAVDPTSPFNYGSLLGDRLRMSDRFNNPDIFIRSVATRGSLGGLSEKMIEITDVLKAAPFDIILVETVGVGQSEVEIAGLADITVLVMVPESGDEIQTLKSGIMEIADIFVVNKSDREGADKIFQSLQQLSSFHKNASGRRPVIKASAILNEGTEELLNSIISQLHSPDRNEKRLFLFTEKLFRIIQKQRMMRVEKSELMKKVREYLDASGNVNIYKLAESF